MPRTATAFACLLIAFACLAGCGAGPVGPSAEDAPPAQDARPDAPADLPAPDLPPPADHMVPDMDGPPDVPPDDGGALDAAADLTGSDGGECPPGQVRCGGECRDTAADPLHCGACERPCPVPAGGRTACRAGRCEPACDTGRHPCGTRCVPDEDPNTCGARCEPCPAGPPGSLPTCESGACGFACGSGLHRCGEACVPVESPMACGTSCSPCPAAPNSEATCDGTRCGLRCRDGSADCDMAPGNGCEVSVATDPQNCGTCGRSCPMLPNAVPACAGGACRFVCRGGFADCNASTVDGCETVGSCTREVTLFSDGFEGGSLSRNWVASLDWSLVEIPVHEGRWSVEGSYRSDAFASMCAEHGELEMLNDISLATATSARLEFHEILDSGARDGLDVLASVDGGTSWAPLGTSGPSAAWRPRSFDLSPYLGRPRFRVAFRFRNACGDCCGVIWGLDAVAVRATVAVP